VGDRLFFVLMGLAAAAAVALALVWPQGLGARSPGPFGGPTAAETAGPQAPPAPAIERSLL
jgi:hypothetical protein